MKEKKRLKTGLVLKALIEKHGITVMELARQVGIGQPVIYRITTDETDNPKIQTLYTLACFFGITVNQLIGVEKLYLTPEENEIKNRTEAPLISWNEASNWFSKPKSNARVALDSSTKQGRIYALEVQDDSMEPLFLPGTILLVEGDRTPENGSFAIVKLHKEEKAILRQVLFDGQLQYLKPLHQDSDKHKIKLFSKHDKYCGVVIQLRRNF